MISEFGMSYQSLIVGISFDASPTLLSGFKSDYQRSSAPLEPVRFGLGTSSCGDNPIPMRLSAMPSESKYYHKNVPNRERGDFVMGMMI
jgi:hypothetical protein